MKKLYYFSLLLLLIGFSFTAAQWNSTLFINQYPSPYMSNWENDPTIGSLTLNGIAGTRIYFSVRITHNRIGEVLNAQSDIYILTSPIQVFTTYEVVNWNDVNYNTSIREQVVRSGRFPEGSYELCVRVLSESGSELTQSCATFSILYPEPPQLIYPVNSSSITEELPMFQWSPVITPPDFPVRYLLKIVEKLPGQSLSRAIEANYPHQIDSVDIISSYNYPASALPFEFGKEYVWQVTAIDQYGYPVTSNNGKSEIWSFYFGSRPSEVSELPVDTLKIIDETAYLINLRRLTITESGTAFNLNGTASLLLKFSDGSTRSIDVFVDNLLLMKGDYLNPQFLSGRVYATLSTYDIPEFIRGQFFIPRDIEFNPLSGLTVGGDLSLPGVTTNFSLTGRLNLSIVGLSGSLTVTQDVSSPLYSFDTELSKLKITRAAINFSLPQVNLGGVLELFGSPVPSEIDNLLLNNDGLINASVNFTNPYSIPLISGTNRIAINIASVIGSISANFNTRSFTYNLYATGGLDFQPTETTKFGADIVLHIQNSGLNVEQFRPRGDLNFSSIDLGWLKLKLSDLNLRSLNFIGGNWNFDLASTLEFVLPYFNDLQLPQITNVSISPSGFDIPSINFPTVSLPRVNLEGFEFEFNSFSMSGLNFPWFSWREGSSSGFNLNFGLRLRLPNLPPGTPNELKDPNLNINASYSDGQFNAEIPSRFFSEPGFALPLFSGINFRILQFSGSISASYDNSSGFNFQPNLRLNGKLELPSVFSCGTGTSALDLMRTSIQLSGNGKLSGVIENIVPTCSLQIGLFNFSFRNTNINFYLEGGEQRIRFDATGNISFSISGTTPATADVNLSYELIQNQLITLNGEIRTPFNFDLPPTLPALTFNIARANITERAIIIDGRHQLALSGGTNIGVTFSNLNIDWRDFSIISGSVIFDLPFAFKVSLDGADLRFQAVPRNSSITEAVGIMLNLPDTLGINNSGFYTRGRANIHLKYEGRDLPELDGIFSNDLAFSFSPFKVSRGQIEIFSGSSRIAIINSSGFLPDLSYFGVALLPERLPLPVENIAYLQIKSGGEFLIDYSTVSAGVRLKTRTGQPIRLVIPALQFSKPTPPELLVNFDITIDAISRDLVSGNLNVNIPTDQLSEWDLSEFGIPFALKDLFYGDIGGVNGFRFNSQLKLFGENIGTENLQLTLMPDGRFLADVDLTLNQNIPLVSGSDKVNLNINRVNGSIETQLIPFNLNFNLNLTGGIRLNLGTGNQYGASATFVLSQHGLNINNFNVDMPSTPPTLNLGWIVLGLSSFTVPELSWNKISGWDFVFDLGLKFKFPDLNFELPDISGVEIRRTGIHIPAISIPELSDSARIIAGFGIKPLAFRMRPFTFNWFTFSGDLGDLGFAFDLELSLPQLPTDAASALRNPRISILNAGYRAGKITGTIETKNFDTGLRLPLGSGLNYFVRQISGNLNEVAGQQNFNINLRGDLQLPEFMRCGTDSGVNNTMAALLNIDSRGRLSGTISNFIPTCPISFGIGQLRIVNSSVSFSVGADQQNAIIDLTGSLRIPGTAATDTIEASGNLVIDLLHAEILSGEIAITRPFRLGLPTDNPVLNFTINNASLNREGLRINGMSNLVLSGGASIGVNFENLLFDIRNLDIKSGRATFSSQFALKFVIGTGGLSWSAAPIDVSLTEESAVRLTLPTGLSLSRDGISASGETNVLVRWNNTNYDAVRCVFSSNFTISYNPFRVRSGTADFYLGDRFIARLDSTGFVPGDIFGIIPIPEKLPLPDTSIAYLRLKMGDSVLVQTEPVSGGMRISTRPGRNIQLVIPALKYSDSSPPEIGISFSVVVNTSTFEFVEGSINVTPPSGVDSLISLSRFGIPLNITQLQYAKFGLSYGLKASAKLTLPDALGGLIVNIDTLSISRDGVSGNVRLGSYSTTHSTTETHIARLNLGTMAMFRIQGVEASFGSGSPTVRMSGDIVTEFFRTDRDTAAIHFTAQYGSGGFNFSFDISHLPDAKLPLLLANFQPQPIGTNPAFDLSFTRDDIQLTLSGTLRVPSFGDNFAVSFSGLKISKSGVTVPTVSVTLPADYQRFNLFGAQIELKDLGSDRAISFAYESRIFYVNLSGEITFLDNVSEFRGLRIGTNGSISISGLNLISRAFYIVPNYIAVDTMQIVSNTFRVAGFVKLPEPCDTTHQRYFFSVNPNGTISGSADIRIIDEASGLGSGDRTEFDLWIAKFDPIYVSLNLNVSNIRQSSLKFIADIYLNNDPNKWIKLGNRSGGSVNPGLEVLFDRTVRWGNLQVSPNLLNINWEALKLNLPNVVLSSASNFELILSGNLALDVSGVSGSIQFESWKLSSNGNISNISIRGGSLRIVDVVNIELRDIGFSSTPTTISVRSGSLPSTTSRADTSTQQISVESYFSFGAQIDIDGVGGGGIEEFLTYRTRTSKSLIIRNANVNVPGVIQFRTDLSYEQIASGYYLRMAGRGRIVDAYEVVVIGKVSKISGRTSFGVFVAADVSIFIPPAINLMSVGGGFFYNPEASDLELVRTMAGLDDTTRSRITAEPSSFAVLLYARAAIVTDALVQGRILLTITNRYFALYGKVTLLRQDTYLNGNIFLAVGFQNHFAEGNINIKLKVSVFVEGSAGLGFYVYSSSAWGINGNLNINILSLINARSDLFIGNPGFLLSMSSSWSMNFWIVKISAGFETTIWYIRDVSWGAYFKTWIEASVLAGVVSAKGWLEGALIGEPRFFLYGVAGLKIRVLFISWSGSVWAKFYNRGVDGGFGRDPEMEQLIEEARQAAEDMQEARVAAMEEMNNTQLDALRVSDAQLIAAFNKLYYVGRCARNNFLCAFLIAGILSSEMTSNNPTDAEYSQLQWVATNIWNAPDVPPLSIQDSLRVYRNRIDNLIELANQHRNRVATRLSEVQANIQSLSVNEHSVAGNPVASANFNSPTTSTSVTTSGDTVKNVTSQPDFSISNSLAEQNANTMNRASEEYASIEPSIIERITNLENGILSIDQAFYRSVSPTTASSSVSGAVSLNLSYALSAISALTSVTHNDVCAEYVNLMRRIEEFYKENSYYFYRESEWASRALYQINGRESQIRSALTSMTNRLSDDQKYRVALWRLDMILSLAEATDRIQQLENFTTNWNSLNSSQKTQACIDKGMELWFYTSQKGLRALDSTARYMMAQNPTQLDQELQNLNQVQATYTNAVDELYNNKIQLTEKLYGIYDRYIYWKRDQPDSIKRRPISYSDLLNKKNQLTRELTIPRVSSINIMTQDMNFWNNSTFSWAGTHPLGIFEYAISFLDRSTTVIPFAQYYSVGNIWSLNRYYLQRLATERQRYNSILVRARAGAGYTHTRFANFTLNFATAPSGTNPVSTFNITADATPPNTPVVRFNQYKFKPSAHGTPISGLSVYYSYDVSQILVSWQASDPQSGIIEYKYSVGINPGDSSIVRWTSAGGRTEVAIIGLNLRHNQRYYVNVRAKNGDNLWSAIGSSYPLLIDTTQPSSPRAKFLTLPLGSVVSTMLTTSVTVNPPIPFPSEITSSSSSSSTVSIGGGVIGGVGTGAGFVTGPTFTLTTGGISPSISTMWDSASDFQSGIYEYQYLIISKRDTNRRSENWTSVGNNLSATISGGILTYLDTFYVDIVAVNYAGLISSPLRLGPFRPVDPTPPTKPNLNISYGPTAGSVYLIFSELSKDDETNIKGYQIAIGTSPGSTNIKAWNDSIDFRSVNRAGSKYYILLPNYRLSDGTYYISVRARNFDNQLSSACVTGPYYVDSSPPVTPIATPTISGTGVFKMLSISFSNISDPQSGVAKIEYAVQVRNRTTPVSWSTYTMTLTTATPLSFLISNLGATTGDNIYIGARTTNTVGLVSAEFWTSIRVP